MSYKDSCRTCLGKTTDMRHIHSFVLIGGVDVRLSDILKDFYDFQVPDDLNDPQNLCINCIHQLTMTKAFKSLIETSTQTLTGTADDFECYAEVDPMDEYYDLSKPDTDYKPDSEDPIKTYKPQSLPQTYKVRTIEKVTGKNLARKIAEIDKVCFCVECKAEFPNTKKLLQHCKKNHAIKSIKGRDCSYCLEKFEDYKDLLIHTKLHLKPYLCLACWTGFYKENDYITHDCKPGIRKNRQSEKVLSQCDQCGKSYPSGYIKIHMATHGTEMKYSCKYCPKKFKVANGLNSHVLWNHKRTRDHKCDTCGATFISASARSTHYRKNHLKEKKYACENCAKRFFSKSELQRHMLTHTGVKNFHCHMCEKSYQTRYGLNVHLKSHTQVNVNVLM